MAFKDNSKEVKQRLRQAISRGLDTAGVIVQGEAQTLSPVDSGYLRDSIDTRQEEEQTDVFVQSVGTPAEHAVFNEFGTGIYAENGEGRKGGWVYPDPYGAVDEKGNLIFYETFGIEPQPFLRPAFRKNKSRIKTVIEQELKGAL